jgi:hypothetical protein
LAAVEQAWAPAEVVPGSQRQPLAQLTLQAVALNLRRELVAALQALQRWQVAAKSRP